MEIRRIANDAWFSNNQDTSKRCLSLRKRFETPSVPTFYIYRRWNESSGAKAYASEGSPPKVRHRMTMTKVASDRPKAFDSVADGGAQRKPPVQNGQADGYAEGVRAQSALLFSLRDKTPKPKPRPTVRCATAGYRLTIASR